MLLSVVIPLYNGENTIDRVLASVANQINFNINDIEIIICNDKSTDNSLQKINKWLGKLNIKIIETEDRSFHSPGNTRHDALPHVTGDWVTFIDCDDEFELNFFTDAFTEIKEKNINKVVSGLVREWNSERNYPKKVLSKPELEAVLHGKIYNTSWLKKHNINFCLDMSLLEDLYFNVKVNCALQADNDTNYTINKYFYKWMYYDSSFSHSNFGAASSSSYTVAYMKGYLLSGVCAYFDEYNNVNDEVKIYMHNQIIYNIMHAYFYIQAALYYDFLNTNDYKELYNFFIDIIEKIYNELAITRQDIILFALSDVDRYYRIKSTCQGGKAHFVELKSFNDFILNK